MHRAGHLLWTMSSSREGSHQSFGRPASEHCSGPTWAQLGSFEQTRKENVQQAGAWAGALLCHCVWKVLHKLPHVTSRAQASCTRSYATFSCEGLSHRLCRVSASAQLESPAPCSLCSAGQKLKQRRRWWSQLRRPWKFWRTRTWPRSQAHQRERLQHLREPAAAPWMPGTSRNTCARTPCASTR